MKIEVVYGCPCSGKTTYAQQQMKENDIIYDYDRLLTALTGSEYHSENKHPAHEIILQYREILLSELKKNTGIKTLYLITRWPTDYLKKMLEGFKVNYHYVKATKQECFDRLKNDETRKNKEAWEEIIEKWFREHGEEKRSAYQMKEKRIIEIRATDPAGDDNGLIIKGMPVVFEQETEILDPAGSYKEIIRRGALDDCNLSDVRLLYNHDTNRIPLARTPKTLQFNLSPAGLEIVANLPNTEEARSVHTAVKTDLLTGMSFAFTVPPGGDRYDPKTNTREILKISKIFECSIVNYPAYPTTSVEARSVIESHSNDAAKEAMKIAINKILFKGDL